MVEIDERRGVESVDLVFGEIVEGAVEVVVGGRENDVLIVVFCAKEDAVECSGVALVWDVAIMISVSGFVVDFYVVAERYVGGGRERVGELFCDVGEVQA